LSILSFSLAIDEYPEQNMCQTSLISLYGK